MASLFLEMKANPGLDQPLDSSFTEAAPLRIALIVNSVDYSKLRGRKDKNYRHIDLPLTAIDSKTVEFSLKHIEGLEIRKLADPTWKDLFKALNRIEDEATMASKRG